MTTTDTIAPPVASASGEISFRRWRGLDDIPAMAAANARLRGHVGMIEPIDVDAMRHRYTHLVNSDPATDCILAERDGEVCGYGRVEWHNLNDGDRIFDATVVVEPDAWGHGVARAFIDWAEMRALRVARGLSDDRVAYFANYAFGGDTELEAALVAAGYQAVRWDAEMLRPDMEDIPAVVLPEGYTLRAPEPDELPAVHRMAIDAFAEHWGEYEGSDFELEEWIDDPRFRRDLVVVAWRGGEPAAMVTNMVERLPDGSVRGLLDSVCTHPAHRRLGLARAAIARSLALLRAEGANAAYLGVDTDNHNRALALYESCGFRRVSTSVNYRKRMPGMKERP